MAPGPVRLTIKLKLPDEAYSPAVLGMGYDLKHKGS
jgi:hypothetical protein